MADLCHSNSVPRVKNVNESQRPRQHLLWPSFQKTAVISTRPLNSNGPSSSLTVTDFDPLGPFVLFSFGDVKVVVIRTMALLAN